jgi:predicted ATPase
MSAVKALSVSGYKSIRELHDFPLTNLNVLIGANGAGKSNFISLFRLLNEIVEQRLQLYSQVQGGCDALLHFGLTTTERMQADFRFSHNAYQFELLPSSGNRLVFGDEISLVGDYYAAMSGKFDLEESYKVQENFQQKQTKSSNPEKVTVQDGTLMEVFELGTGHSESKLKDTQNEGCIYTKKSVSNWRVYHFQDTSDTAKVKRVHASNINLRLLPDAGNLAAYLRMLHEKHLNEYRHIVEVIRLVAPFFDDFVHRPDNPEFVELEWTQAGKPDMPFKAHYLSDGTLRFMCLATLLLQPVALLPDTILIDEPELGLHPYAISVLADMFKQVAEDKQLIVSTQSVELVNALSPEDIIVVEQADGASTFKRFTQEELSGWLEEYSLGDLWNSNILGGRP